MKKLVIVVGLCGVFAASWSCADEIGTHDPKVNKRQHRQHARIHEGVKSGELTHSEARALRMEQRAIRQKERAYKSDGTLTKDERKELHEDLNAASANIHEEKHDAEVRK
jgi:Ni/Co efflux regulator RcnB